MTASTKSPVGALPDMLTFTHDGSKLLVANEGTPKRRCRRRLTRLRSGGQRQHHRHGDPHGRGHGGLRGVPTEGSNLRDQHRAWTSSPIHRGDQGRHQGLRHRCRKPTPSRVLDLTTNAFTRVIGLGAKDFNRFATKSIPGTTTAASVPLRWPPRASTCPTAWRSTVAGRDLYSAGQRRRLPRRQRRPVGRQRVRRCRPAGPSPRRQPRSSAGNLFAAGARSFSIRDGDGDLVFDSGSLLDKQAHVRGIYDDSRSRDKGVEPEGVALLDIGGRTYAFVGLERTLKSAVADLRHHQPLRCAVRRHDRHRRRPLAGGSGRL